MQLRNFFFLGLILFALLSGCSLFSREEDVIKMSSLPAVKNQFIPLTVWSSNVGSGIGDFYSNLHPAFIDNVVYAADRNGAVCAFNVNDGKKIWSINLLKKRRWFLQTPELLSGGLAVTENHIYVGSENGKLYSLNARDGTITWETRVAGEVLSCPVINNGLVLIHTSNGQLQVLNEIDGEIKWTVNLDAPSFSLRGQSTPATIFGVAIVGGDNGCVSAVLAQQGKIIWQQRISQAIGRSKISRLSDVDATPVIINEVVYALAYNGNLTALDLSSGEIIWKRNLGGVNDFIVHAGRIYLVDQNDRLLALSTESGVTLWTQGNLLHRFLTAPALYNGKLVVGDCAGYIHWLDLETGCFVAQHKVDRSGFLTKPVVVNGKLLIQAKNGRLYAIVS